MRMVIGYTGEVDVIAATLLAIYFWWEHIAGLRYYYLAGTFWSYGYGGYFGAISFFRARDFLGDLIEDLRATAVFTASAIVSIIVCYFVGPLQAGILDTIFIAEFKRTLGDIITSAVFGSWVLACMDAINAFSKVDNGEYIPSLITVSGGAGINKYNTVA